MLGLGNLGLDQSGRCSEVQRRLYPSHFAPKTVPTSKVRFSEALALLEVRASRRLRPNPSALTATAPQLPSGLRLSPPDHPSLPPEQRPRPPCLHPSGRSRLSHALPPAASRLRRPGEWAPTHDGRHRALARRLRVGHAQARQQEQQGHTAAGKHAEQGRARHDSSGAAKPGVHAKRGEET